MDLSIFDEENLMHQNYLDLHDRHCEIEYLLSCTNLDKEELLRMCDISWLHHENGIEGIPISFNEIKNAIEKKKNSDIHLHLTYKNIQNQKWCIDQIRKKVKQKKTFITITFLKAIHNKLVRNPKVAGVYRKDIPIHRTYVHEIEQPRNIAKKLTKLIQNLKKNEQELHPIHLAGVIHYHFMKIFPFSKYSGFIGRLLVNFIFERSDYLPLIINTSLRQNYYIALRTSENEFCKFLVNSMELSIDSTIRFLKSYRKS